MTGPTPRDGGGWAPLEAYAVLGDGRSVALVADDGRIDWWPVPAIDSPPLCAAILDPGSGGWFGLAPTGPATSTRRYLPGTNVLETTWETTTGTVRVTDALVTGRAGRLPWTELTRRVDGVRGEVELEWQFHPGDRFDKVSPWARLREDTPVVTIGDQFVALLVDKGTDLEVSPHRLTGRLRVGEGERALVSAVASDHEPLYLSPVHALYGRLEHTRASWESWSEQVATPGRWEEEVCRSALALKTLLYEPGGAIAAAATTSLPERVGGPKNWDYRYSWVRDSSFTVDAFINLGLHEEVQAAVSWLLSALRNSAPHMEIFYTLEGEVPEGIGELDVPGYRHSRPVREGNSASGQVQLGVYGDLFDTIWRYVQAGHLIDDSTGALLASLASQCCDRWRARDSGIWELGDRQHYTISKIGCWTALDRAVHLADAGQITDRERDRWHDEAEAIREFVHTRCWSDAKRSYTFYAGTEELDAACLLAGRTGFDRGERLAGTIEAVVTELADGPRVWRYTGMPEEEGAFIACSFWLAEAYAHIGRLPQAEQLMDASVALANDVGILSEQAARDGGLLGNLPQGLSHLALVNTAFAIERARQGEGVGSGGR